MKSKYIGLVILILVIAGAAAYVLFGGAEKPQEIVGYVGGEKIGLLEDEEVQKILLKQYKISIDYAKAGSLDMVRADQSGQNFLFPSSQTALELYKGIYGKPKKDEIIFNTPIVLYTYKPVQEAMMKQGMVTEQNGSYYIDMEKLVVCIEEGKTWSDIGLNQLHGSVVVSTTDPTKSNSGNMFAGLLANVLSGGEVVDSDTIDEVIPRLQDIFKKLGYMETSSADLFDQFLKTGMGAKPLVAGYESQLLEFAVENPDVFQSIKDNLVILYPTPTVWSSHIYIALDEVGERGVDGLLDAEIQKIAWNKHGFRTGVYGTVEGTEKFGVNGVTNDVTSITSMPSADMMTKIIQALE